MNSSFDPATGFFVDVRPRSFPWLNVILFLVTCLSTLIVGAVWMLTFNGMGLDGAFSTLLRQPATLTVGLPFCLAIMSILFAHEMGHYLTARHYGVDASLPYFIPFPSPVGTMGAFIKIRSPIYDRGSLLEIGVAGPIAGFVIAVIVLVISFTQAPRFVVPEHLDNTIAIGDPLILKLTESIMGRTAPDGMETLMHPVSFAAWFGFLATALNLLPAAQLDGGHITYALFRRYHKWISGGVVAVLLPLAIFYWTGWFVWIALLLVLKLKHPPTIDDSIPLRPRHVVLGVIGFILLILCFTPAPFII